MNEFVLEDEQWDDEIDMTEDEFDRQWEEAQRIRNTRPRTFAEIKARAEAAGPIEQTDDELERTFLARYDLIRNSHADILWLVAEIERLYGTH
jgi:hypothetical protein